MWKKLNSKTVFSNQWIKIFTDQIEFGPGKTGEYTYLTRHDGAHIVVIDQSNNLLLFKQYRYPTNAYEWSTPGGKIDAGESPKQAAIREAQEELGVKIERIEPLGIWVAQSSLNTEKLYMYVGWTKDAPHPLGLQDESITSVAKLSVEEALKLIDSNEITDPAIASAIQIIIRKYLS